MSTEYERGYVDGHKAGARLATRAATAAIFNAYNQAIEDAMAAIRGENVDDPYAAPTFINAIARKCSPHVYVARLATTGAAAGEQRRSNHFTNDAVERGAFPSHISKDGEAYYGDDAPAATAEGEGQCADMAEPDTDGKTCINCGEEVAHQSFGPPINSAHWYHVATNLVWCKSELDNLALTTTPPAETQDCLGCLAAEAELGRCLIHETKPSGAASPPVETRHCGFCGKSEYEVPTLIQAPLGFICNECVKICADIIKQDEPSTTTPGDAAREAAHELDRLALLNDSNATCALTDEQLKPVIDVISRHFPPTAPAPAGVDDLISRRDAITIAEARLKDVPDTVDLEADRSLFAAGYLAAAGSIKAALERLHCATPAPAESGTSLYNEDGSYTPVAQNIWDHSRVKAIAECVSILNERVKAYDEAIFKPPSQAETQRVHEQWPGLVDRISAAMGRVTIYTLITELESLAKGEEEDG